MKLGELKISSLSLLVPSLEINLDKDDEESLENKIMELKSNPSVTDYISQLTFSINRAFSLIEKHGAIKSKRAFVPFDELIKTARGYEMSLDKIGKDVLTVEKIYQGNECFFENGGASMLLLPRAKKEQLEIIYKPKIKRVSDATSDLYELELSDEIAEIIPYFVKSELLLSEYPDEAKEDRAYFFALLKELASPMREYNQASIDTIFSWE